MAMASVMQNAYHTAGCAVENLRPAFASRAPWQRQKSSAGSKRSDEPGCSRPFCRMRRALQATDLPRHPWFVDSGTGPVGDVGVGDPSRGAGRRRIRPAGGGGAWNRAPRRMLVPRWRARAGCWPGGKVGRADHQGEDVLDRDPGPRSGSVAAGQTRCHRLRAAWAAALRGQS